MFALLFAAAAAFAGTITPSGALATEIAPGQNARAVLQAHLDDDSALTPVWTVPPGLRLPMAAQPVQGPQAMVFVIVAAESDATPGPHELGLALVDDQGQTAASWSWTLTVPERPSLTLALEGVPDRLIAGTQVSATVRLVNTGNTTLHPSLSWSATEPLALGPAPSVPTLAPGQSWEGERRLSAPRRLGKGARAQLSVSVEGLAQASARTRLLPRTTRVEGAPTLSGQATSQVTVTEGLALSQGLELAGDLGQARVDLSLQAESIDGVRWAGGHLGITGQGYHLDLGALPTIRGRLLGPDLAMNGLLARFSRGPCDLTVRHEALAQRPTSGAEAQPATAVEGSCRLGERFEAWVGGRGEHGGARALSAEAGLRAEAAGRWRIDALGAFQVTPNLGPAQLRLEGSWRDHPHIRLDAFLDAQSADLRVDEPARLAARASAAWEAPAGRLQVQAHHTATGPDDQGGVDVKASVVVPSGSLRAAFAATTSRLELIESGRTLGSFGWQGRFGDFSFDAGGQIGTFTQAMAKAQVYGGDAQAAWNHRGHSVQASFSASQDEAGFATQATVEADLRPAKSLVVGGRLTRVTGPDALDEAQVRAALTVPKAFTLSASARVQRRDEVLSPSAEASLQIPLSVRAGAVAHHGPVRGIIRDEEGPVAGVVVTIGDLVAISRADGRFSFRDVPEGKATLTLDPVSLGIDRVGARSRPTTVTVTDDGEGPEVVVDLVRTAKIVGQVQIPATARQAEGQLLGRGDVVSGPLAGLLVWVEQGDERRVARTQADGTFQFAGLRPGTWRFGLDQGALPAEHRPDNIAPIEVDGGAVAEAQVTVRAIARAVQDLGAGDAVPLKKGQAKKRPPSK